MEEKNNENNDISSMDAQKQHEMEKREMASKSAQGHASKEAGNSASDPLAQKDEE